MISDFPMLSDILFETDEFLELQDNIKESNSYSFRILNQNSITQEYSSLFRTSHFQLPNLIIILTNRMKQGIFNLVKKGNTSKIIETRKQFLVNECLISCQTPNNLANAIINDLWMQYMCYLNHTKSEVKWPMKSFIEVFPNLKYGNQLHFPLQCQKFIPNEDVLMKH